MIADCHIHMLLDGAYWRAAIDRHRAAADDAWIHEILARYKELGFTYLRDGGDRWGAGKRARELAPAYGITYRSPLSPLCAKGHYGGFIGTCYADWNEYRLLVQQQKQQGADFIKIMISGIMDFDRFGVLSEPGLPPQAIGDLIAAAHDAGLSVMAHANGAQTVKAAAAAGVDSIEHGAYLDAEALCAMVENRVIWVPTLSAVGNLRGRGRFREEAVQAILDSAMENVRRFAAMGGLIAPGTDAGAWAVPHGSLTEYALLEQCLKEQTHAVLTRGVEEIQKRF